MRRIVIALTLMGMFGCATEPEPEQPKDPNAQKRADDRKKRIDSGGGLPKN